MGTMHGVDARNGLWPDRDTWLRALLTGLAYLAMARYIVLLNDPVNLGAGFWPGAGISLGALLVSPRRAWPAILVAVGAAELLNDLHLGYTLGASLAWTLANVLAPLVGAWLLQRWKADRLDTVGAVARLLFVAGGAALLAGMVGAIGTVALGSAYSYPVIVGKWAVGDGLGMLAVAPSIVWLRDREGRRTLLGPEPIALVATVAALTTLIFLSGDVAWDPVLPYLVLPPLVWAAVRFCVVGAAVTSLVAAMIANSATAVGQGPFAYAELTDDVAIVMLQFFLATATVTALLLGARTSEAAAHAHGLEEQTRRARAGEATAELYRRVLDEAPAAVFVKDDQGHYLLANLATANVFGRSREAVLGRTDHELLPAIAERFAIAEDEVRRSGVRVETDDVVPTEAGSRSFLTLRFPVIDPGSGEVLVAGIATDVSERRALEQRVSMAERLETVGELAGGIAHDFNNLLIVIGGRTQLALDAVTVGDDATESLHEVLRATERASQLGRQLLTFARREPTGTSGRCVVDEVVDHLRGLLQPLLQEHTSLELVLDADDAVVPLAADRLEQVLLNLAVNARDAMPGGGTLTICTERAEVHAPLAHTLPPVQPGAYVLVTVTDTGEGMAPSVRDHALEPFFTTKAPGRGTGLGLASVYGNVTAAGGAIDLVSEPGSGTTARMWFPTVPRVEPVSGSAPDPEFAAGDGQRILVVEDDPDVRELIGRQLQTVGYVVHEASSLAEVAESAEWMDEIDLLVCDVVLTDGAGPEVAEVLRLRQPELPVLYISGYTERTWSGHGRLLSDADRLLRKPFTAVALRRAVVSSLPQTERRVDG
jgi:PAS domain S-box-containing protein